MTRDLKLVPFSGIFYAQPLFQDIFVEQPDLVDIPSPEGKLSL